MYPPVLDFLHAVLLTADEVDAENRQSYGGTSFLAFHIEFLTYYMPIKGIKHHSCFEELIVFSMKY